MERARALRNETALNSITPDRAGGIMYDTLAYINEMQLQNANPLLISKIYDSVADMEDDSAPVSDLDGSNLLPGQLVCIVTGDPDDPEDGLVYRYDGTEGGTSSWTAVGRIGSDPYLEGYQYLGKAVLSPTPTDPGTPTQKVFYEATEPGTYGNFGGLVVNTGEAVRFKWDGTGWAKEITGLAPADSLNDVRAAISKFEGLTATADVSGKFINANGTEGTNAGTGYFKFAVTPGNSYAFSGGFRSTGYNIPYLIAFDAEDNCLGVVGSYMANDGQEYDRELFYAPVGAAYITLNYRVAYKSSFAFFLASLIQSADCLRANGALPVGDLNSVMETGCWLLTGGNYTNLPGASKYGYLRVTRLESYVFQEFISQTGGEVYKRRFQASGANMEDWQRVGRDASMMGALPSGDLDAVTETGTWMLVDSNSYTHVPGGAVAGFLRVSNVGVNNWILQEFIGFSSAKYFKRKFRVGQTVEDWMELSGDEINYNTYNVTATPEITADTNQFLAESGDTSDRTLDILTLLQTTGVCRLGPGTFYVDGLEMPSDSMLIGSGAATVLRLVDGNNKFAVKMGSRCAVKDIYFKGAGSAPSFTSTRGTRHAIVWQGDYTQSGSSANQPQFGMISGCRFINFSGSAIFCSDTGVGTSNHLEAVNCVAQSCWAGIDVAYYSEFHKFTNVRCWSCYYGAVNNGGNNVFVNCDFSGCTEGFLMDNASNQSPNNSHGSCVGCVFNHSGSNSGVGIRVLGCPNGFVFTGCQIFYSKTIIENSGGVIFNACNYGDTNCDITIDGGGAVLFLGNMHQAAPTITITDNTNVHFANCYVRSTGAPVSN